MPKIKAVLAGALALFTLALSASQSQTIIDIYKFTMKLHVPQVLNNMESRGRRVYKSQNFIGTILVRYHKNATADVIVSCLTNRSFKVKGYPVTYDVETTYALWNLIGNNATEEFKKPSVYLELDAQPSYVASYKPTEDNSLILSLAGTGSSRKGIRGYVSGTLGCGCADYGHVSPTRVMGACGPLPLVSDVAGVYGSWSLIWKTRVICTE